MTLDIAAAFDTLVRLPFNVGPISVLSLHASCLPLRSCHPNVLRMKVCSDIKKKEKKRKTHKDCFRQTLTARPLSQTNQSVAKALWWMRAETSPPPSLLFAFSPHQSLLSSQIPPSELHPFIHLSIHSQLQGPSHSCIQNFYKVKHWYHLSPHCHWCKY